MSVFRGCTKNISGLETKFGRRNFFRCPFRWAPLRSGECWGLWKGGCGRLQCWYRRLPACQVGFLGGGNSNIFYVHPEHWGKMNPFWTNIFQMGWFNHQLVFVTAATSWRVARNFLETYAKSWQQKKAIWIYPLRKRLENPAWMKMYFPLKILDFPTTLKTGIIQWDSF